MAPFVPLLLMSLVQNTGLADARKGRTGCLGCFGQVGLTLVVVGFVMLAAAAVFDPWAFYLGGSFHVLPWWQGWGKLHAKSGDYLMYVRIQPTTKGSKMYLATDLGGNAAICTPRGEKLALKMGGGMRKHLNVSTDAEAINLYMYYRPWNYSFTNDDRPSLKLRGHWRNPNLVMDDEGSIGKAFQADGSVYRGKTPNRPAAPDIVPITFVPGSYSDFSAACAAIHR